MADTLDSIDITADDWVDLNVASGIPVGTAIEIQNQSSTAMVVAISPTKPALDFKGVIVPPLPAEMATIDAGENTVWVLADGPVNVQVS